MPMKLEWWKTLSVVLMIYVIVAGFMIPLKPGIIEVTIDKAQEGDSYQTGIRCYNSYLEKTSDTRVWLWLPDDRLIQADDVQIINDTYLNVGFNQLPTDITDGGRAVMASIMIDNSAEGHYFFRNAVNIKAGKGNSDIKANYVGLDQIKTKKSLAFPFQHILYETTRNTYFHVAIWMAMFALLISSCFYSVQYLIKKDIVSDHKASSITTVAIVFGIAGILTGSMWAKHTWGAYWTEDIKLNMTAVALLIYLAYWVLRGSLNDPDSRARLSAVFNIFAFVSLFVLVMVIPRLTDSLHPGNGGNPAFSSYDMDNTMRMVFYPAIIAYFLLGLWIAQIHFRYLRLQEDILN